MRKLFLLFFVMLAITIAAHAQTRTVTGVVTGEGETEPLIGVTITVKGSPLATATDINGKFSIKVTDLQNVTIGAKFIGFQYQEQTIKPGQTVLNFKLAKSSTDLAEVAVVSVGYGTVAKAKVLGSVSEIKASDIEDVPVANLGTALMNRVAGVGVSVASGKPGATTTITLQGAYSPSAGSLGTTSDPLFVIDGLIATKADFDNLDASLIETISFLKDAQAAIYGAAADKGVVLVTTKKGKPGKPQINYTGYFSTANNAFTPKLLSGVQEAQAINDYLDATNATTGKFSQADLTTIANTPYPSWYSQLWHSSQSKRHTINVSGGTEKVTFFGGASYYEEGGNFGLTDIKKYNIRSGMTAKITDEVTAFISLNTSYEYDVRNTAKSENNDTENNTTTAIFLTPTWVPLTINGLPITYSGPSAAGGAWNPLGFFNSGAYTYNNNQSINLNSSIEYRPHQIKGLTAKVQFGKNLYLGNAKNYYPSYNTYTFASTGNNGALFTNTQTAIKNNASANQLLYGTTTTNEYELIGSLDYSRSIKKNNFSLLLVGTQNETNAFSFNTYRTNQQVPGVDQWFAFDPSTTTVQNPQATQAGNIGWVGRFSYDYAGKYLFQFIDRIDGSSNFAPGKRFGSSPAVAAGWRVSEENWYKKSKIANYMTSLKVRYNIGITGDSRVSPFLYEPRYTPYAQTVLFGSSLTNGLDPSYVTSPDLTWEHNRAQTLGFDAGFFNDRLNITYEIWNKHYYDGLVDLGSVATPWTFGIASAIVNYNEANTWGQTVTISYVGNINKDLQFNANVNFGWGDTQPTQAYYNPANLGATNEYQLITTGQLASQWSSTNVGLIAKGIIRSQAQLDAILSKNPNYTIEGKTPQVGWMDFVDINGDGKITAAQDEAPLYKSISPALSMGWTWGLAYKTFKFNINGYLQLGGKITASERTPPTSATSSSSGSLNAPYFWTDHWTPTNVNAQYPRLDSQDMTENSTFWIRSGTRLYINNASLSYALPKSIGDRLKIPTLRFILTGQNLWAIINPFDYKDVRQSNLQSYPTLRTWSLGVNLTL